MSSERICENYAGEIKKNMNLLQSSLPDLLTNSERGSLAASSVLRDCLDDITQGADFFSLETNLVRDRIIQVLAQLKSVECNPHYMSAIEKLSSVTEEKPGETTGGVPFRCLLTDEVFSLDLRNFVENIPKEGGGVLECSSCGRVMGLVIRAGSRAFSFCSDGRHALSTK